MLCMCYVFLHKNEIGRQYTRTFKMFFNFFFYCSVFLKELGVMKFSASILGFFDRRTMLGVSVSLPREVTAVIL